MRLRPTAVERATRFATVFATLALVSVHTAGANSIIVTSPTTVGGVLEVAFTAPAWVDAAEVELRSSSGARIRTWAFTRPDWDTWFALLGVPSWEGPGSYTVSAYLYQLRGEDVGSARVVRRTETFEIGSRQFRSERIVLDHAMSRLRQDDSGQRRVQSLRLAELLYTTDTAAIYALRELELPIATDRRTSEFGDRRIFLYSDGKEGGSIHHGIDFGAPTGTPVYAPGPGRVVMAESRIITGNTIVIEHLPGVYTLYYHLDRLSVEENDRVQTRQPLGTVGSTGLSTGPHLHWELRVAGVPVDPEPYLARPLLDFRRDSSKIGDQHQSN